MNFNDIRNRWLDTYFNKKYDAYRYIHSFVLSEMNSCNGRLLSLDKLDQSNVYIKRGTNMKVSTNTNIISVSQHPINRLN